MGGSGTDCFATGAACFHLALAAVLWNDGNLALFHNGSVHQSAQLARSVYGEFLPAGGQWLAMDAPGRVFVLRLGSDGGQPQAGSQRCNDCSESAHFGAAGFLGAAAHWRALFAAF